MNKKLVVFFSHRGETYFPGGYKNVIKGNASIIADKARALLKADMFEIRAKDDYPEGYDECCKRAKEEQKKNVLPELLGYMPSLDGYEDIILIYPCWWGTMPQPVFTFLNHYDFSDKNIYPICTHEGSGMGNSETDLSKTCEFANIFAGLAIQGSTSLECDKKLEKWLKVNQLI
ncbi:MAG: flavodoxin [Clostridia bacterium]|nr:flavodoxin [Clostridia bacterium]